MIARIAVLLVLWTASALTQPVTFEIKSDVPQGQKPLLRVTAAQKVTDVRVELDRDDGKHVSLARPALARGEAVTWPIGDGAPGKAQYKGKLSGKAEGSTERFSEDISFATLVRAPVKIGYDIEHLDLDKHVLQFTVSRAAGSAELTVVDDRGTELGTFAATYNHEPAGTWLPITWKQPHDAHVMTMKLHVTTADGLDSTVQLTPWSVSIDHEDVNFATDSSVIEPSEAPKLDASLAKIQDVIARSERFVKMQLYVAGHTDTVGPKDKNRTLSLARARAIAQYFRKQGLALPIAIAGFGEEVPKIPTPDNTDERANRRADYVLGPVGGSPPFKGGYTKVKAGWQPLK